MNEHASILANFLFFGSLFLICINIGKRISDRLPKSIEPWEAGYILVHISRYMYGADWLITRVQLAAIVNKFLPLLLSKRLDLVEMRYIIATEVDVPASVGVDRDIDGIARLLHELENECQEQGGGWISPPEVRERISELHRSLKRIG